MTPSNCFRCGEPLPEGARFCPNCGAPVAGEEAGQERKLVTVLFADLAGSTELSTRLDPERYRELMAAFYRAATEELASLRGRAEKFAGDAVMAVFGLPHAHEDDALRGVRAGLSIRDRVERLGRRVGLDEPLGVRVGVNTGPVVASTQPAGEFMVSGAAVNLAARLQQAAAPGEVLVGETTFQLTLHAASFGEPRTIRAKGFAEEVVVRPVESLTSRSTRRTIPLVGRRRELDLVLGAVERAAETRRAHLVTVVGEPGIGKSRLVQELVASVAEGSEVLVGRASEFEEEVAFAPLVDLVRRRLGVAGEAPPEELRRRLHDVVSGCCDASDAERVTGQLGLLLGVGDEPREGTRYRAAEIRAGFLSFVEGLARTAPVVVLLEDLHLARPPLLDLLEEVVRRARRMALTLVAVAREELLRHRPTWGAGLSDALVLRLEPLSYQESQELARAAAGELDDATAERIAREAGGNPFFIVEITGMLLHEADAHTHPGRAPAPALPPTVQAVVASRIDHLPEPARNVIRVASIFPGGAFHESRLGLVAEVSPEVVATLEDEELIVRDEDRPGRWLFRHELLREAAYDSLPKRERRRLHERVVEGIEAAEEPERHAQQIAYHLEEAAGAALDLDPADRGPAARAERALGRAGDLARRRMELRVAIDLYERALALAGPSEGWGDEEARILAGIGEARYWLGEYEDAERSLDHALELGRDDPWTRTLALRFAADIVLNIHGDPDRAEKMFDDALAAADELGDPWATARTLLMAGWVPYWRGDLDGAQAMFQRALEIARSNPQGDRWGEARALISFASVCPPEWTPGRRLEMADEALRLGREMGDPFTVATAQERRSNAYRAMWRLQEALACSDEAVRIYRDLGARWELASALGDRGVVLRLLSRLEDAEANLGEAVALCRELGDRVLIGWTAAELGTVVLLRGRPDEAREILFDPTLPAPAEGPGDRSAILWTRAYLALAEGDVEAARGLAGRAAEFDAAEDRGLGAALSTWWLGVLFGAEAAGGQEAWDSARERIERTGWVRAFHEADQITGALGLALT